MTTTSKSWRDSKNLIPKLGDTFRAATGLDCTDAEIVAVAGMLVIAVSEAAKMPHGLDGILDLLPEFDQISFVANRFAGSYLPGLVKAGIVNISAFSESLDRFEATGEVPSDREPVATT